MLEHSNLIFHMARRNKKISTCSHVGGIISSFFFYVFTFRFRRRAHKSKDIFIFVLFFLLHSLGCYSPEPSKHESDFTDISFSPFEWSKKTTKRDISFTPDFFLGSPMGCLDEISKIFLLAYVVNPRESYNFLISFFFFASPCTKQIQISIHFWRFFAYSLICLLACNFSISFNFSLSILHKKTAHETSTGHRKVWFTVCKLCTFTRSVCNNVRLFSVMIL